MECQLALDQVKQLEQEGFSEEMIKQLLPKLEQVSALKEEERKELKKRMPHPNILKQIRINPVYTGILKKQTCTILESKISIWIFLPRVRHPERELEPKY